MERFNSELIDAELSNDIEHIEFMEQELQKNLDQAEYEYARCKRDYGLKLELIEYTKLMRETKQAKDRVIKILDNQ